mmetsp:Transcript_504/g.1947  ORF Transcript_504/g.1947 Transcript_504/m.1947 type:complete len:297 (+) Transcript_504:2117-3007(+)
MLHSSRSMSRTHCLVPPRFSRWPSASRSLASSSSASLPPVPRLSVPTAMYASPSLPSSTRAWWTATMPAKWNMCSTVCVSDHGSTSVRRRCRRRPFLPSARRTFGAVASSVERSFMRSSCRLALADSPAARSFTWECLSTGAVEASAARARGCRCACFFATGAMPSTPLRKHSAGGIRVKPPSSAPRSTQLNPPSAPPTSGVPLVPRGPEKRCRSPSMKLWWLTTSPKDVPAADASAPTRLRACMRLASRALTCSDRTPDTPRICFERSSALAAIATAALGSATSASCRSRIAASS